jgi:hypothetical protein
MHYRRSLIRSIKFFWIKFDDSAMHETGLSRENQNYNVYVNEHGFYPYIKPPTVRHGSDFPLCLSSCMIVNEFLTG